MPPRERRVTANGLEHHVLEWGSAQASETFILCHGFLDHAWSWRQVAERLAARGHRAIAFSWRGHGETDWIGAGGYYHFQDYVLDLHDLWAELAGPKTHLVGHSMGGSVCCLFAGSHPSAMDTLTLIEGLGPPATKGMPPDRMKAWLAAMDRVRATPVGVVADLAQAVQRMRAMNAELPADLGMELAVKGTRPHPDGEGLAWRFDPRHRTPSPRMFRPAELLTFLAAIEAPTLVVSGSRGFQTADHDMRVAAIPGARELRLENVGHMIHWLAADRLVDALLKHARRAIPK